jgi:hypothetical protein
LYFTATRSGHAEKERAVRLDVTPAGVAVAGVF